MSKEIHKGVGLLIGNSDQTRFFVQIKDEEYPFVEWRGACAYWGGAIEEDDISELKAVERELEEELPGAVPILKDIPKIRIDKYWVDEVESPFWLTIFEVVVSDKQLMEVAVNKVLEGYGRLMTREEILESKWIWKMDFIFKKYLEIKDKS
jgi:hypothetical protein